MPPVVETRRLTRDQLEGAVRGLLAPRLGAELETAWTAVAEALAQVPRDIPSDQQDYARMSQAVGQAHVDAWYGVARAVAELATASAARRRAFFGDCAESAEPACVEAFVRRFGEAALRRPLEPAKVRFYVDDVFGANGGVMGWRDVVTALLSSPSFLYAFELGAESAGGDAVRALGPYELAARLALHFWRAGPDAELLEAARSGRILDPAGYREEVRRVFRDPRTRATLDAFVVDWLDLHAVPDPASSIDRADLLALAGDDVPQPGLRSAAIREVLDLVRHYTWTEPAGLDALFTTTKGFPRSPGLARLYDLDRAWQPGQPPLELGADRAGVLTRVALLLNDQATTRPIIKGVRVRNRLLCDELELPENMDEIELDAPSGDRSTRQRVEDLTEREGSVCVGCHQQINPPGFALEAFDPLGRSRSVERVFDAEGTLRGTHPVDTRSDVRLDGRPVPVASASDLGRRLAESDEVRACFAQQYVRFTFGRREVFPNDGCLLESIRSALERGATLAEVFEQIALHPAFALVRKS
jgi:hypothetical protein